MRRALRGFILITACLAALPAAGAVRVDQDEVMFVFKSAGANEVFLVGDFNQWNPTVEPMNRVDDHFEVGLFLVAGDYRYQFVVDGKWISDPDNTPAAGERGSPLRLVERGNALVLSTEVVSAAAPAAHATPGARYIGAMRSRDATDTSHRVDLDVKGRFDRLRMRASVATDDSSWAWTSGPSVDFWFDRGRVDIDLGKWKATGFENDSTWSSLDPTALVGNAGVYGYNAGLRRHGGAGVVVNDHLALRVLYADATARAPSGSTELAQQPLDDFIAGASSDTSMYATRRSFDGSDVLALEGGLDLNGMAGGLVFRRESSVNPGVAADLDRAVTRIDAVTYATRENRAASSFWLRDDNLFGARLTGSYGWGSIKAHAYAAGADSVIATQPVSAADAVAEIDRTFPVLETHRGLVELGARARRGRHAFVRWDFTRFDFDGLRGDSRADIQRITVSAADTLKAWTVGVHVRYTDADYGNTPGELAIDWNELNPWLSIWDNYDAPAIVGLAFERYDVATVSAGRRWKRIEANAAFTAGLRGVAEDMVFGSVRAQADAHVRGPWHASAYVRNAWYDSQRWSSDGALWSGYLEVRFHRRPFDLSMGFGFDPVVFNRVTAEYADIGYTEYLRDVLSGGVSRARADDIVRSLIARENALEDAAVFKIELVVDLR